MISYVSESELFEQLVAMVQSAKNVDQASRLMESKRDACATLSAIEQFVATANAPSHPIRNQLLRLTAECDAAQASSDLFAIIKQEGRV